MPYKDRTSPAAVASLRAARRRHYEANSEVYKQRARERTARLKRLVRDAKDRPCMDCGAAYPWYVMDLDHRPDEEKLAEVSDLVVAGSAEARIVGEIAKCDVVCANCHRSRTYTRLMAADQAEDVF